MCGRIEGLDQNDLFDRDQSLSKGNCIGHGHLLLLLLLFIEYALPRSRTIHSLCSKQFSMRRCARRLLNLSVERTTSSSGDSSARDGLSDLLKGLSENGHLAR